MNRREADHLGKEVSQDFINAFDALIDEGYYDNARAMVLSTYPFALASVKPELRAYALADIFDMYYRVGMGVYEDAEDLYQHLTIRTESLE